MAAAETISKTPRNIPCTSKPCTWNVTAGERRLEPQPIQPVKFCKHEYGKVKNIIQKNMVILEHSTNKVAASGDLNVFITKRKRLKKNLAR